MHNKLCGPDSKHVGQWSSVPTICSSLLETSGSSFSLSLSPSSVLSLLSSSSWIPKDGLGSHTGEIWLTVRMHIIICTTIGSDASPRCCHVCTIYVCLAREDTRTKMLTCLVSICKVFPCALIRLHIHQCDENHYEKSSQKIACVIAPGRVSRQKRRADIL